MKLKKINTDHFVILNDDPIEIDDFYLDDSNNIRSSITDDRSYWESRPSYKKIIYTTDISVNELYYIPLHEVKELIEETKVNEKSKAYGESIGNQDGTAHFDFKMGYKQCLADNSDKKYTEADIINTIEYTLTLVGNHWNDIRWEIGTDKFKSVRPGIESFLKSFDIKTEWEVEFDSDGKLILI